MSYEPIENYGAIGNLKTVALVNLNGSIDWFCTPRFDSPSVFAKILDDVKGGFFSISPENTEGVSFRQYYLPDTNILVTRFLHKDGTAEIQDFMPIDPAVIPKIQIIRRVKVIRGVMKLQMLCQPAFDYARRACTTTVKGNSAMFASGNDYLGLSASVGLQKNQCGVGAHFTLHEGETTQFVFGFLSGPEEMAEATTDAKSEQIFQHTLSFWQKWISQCTYQGRWREAVRRSALTLKLLSYEPTGAIVAAATTSLPEFVGGGRNWDYRYTWLRDASFTIYAFLRIGFKEEAVKFMDWLGQRWSSEKCGNGSPLQLMYAIDGRTDLKEEELSHLDGYQGSRPVRIGNAAHEQLQLDIYGELMDSVYLYNKHAAPVGYDAWTKLQNLVNWVCDNWEREDDGIWEVRSGRQHFVYSKLMSWVAVDRGLRLADKRSFPADRAKWAKTRDTIYEQIMVRGWSEEREAFVQAYGSSSLDAANLLMPLLFFTSADDPRILKTIEAIRRPTKNGGLAMGELIYRYNSEETNDGTKRPEGAFTMCSFWLVEALTRAGRTQPKYLDEARLLFEQMLNCGNHLGLYSEQIGPSGEALGNFPQAFTHLGLISAAFNLDRALG